MNSEQHNVLHRISMEMEATYEEISVVKLAVHGLSFTSKSDILVELQVGLATTEVNCQPIPALKQIKMSSMPIWNLRNMSACQKLPN